MSNISEIKISTENQQLIQADVAYHYGVIPKYLENDILTFFAKDEIDIESSTNELELILGKKIVLEIVESSIINKALSKYYRNSGKSNSNNEFKLGGDFLENLIWDAKSTDSSDIHFEVFKDSARIRFRIDGKLIERYKVKLEDYSELVNKIKIKSNLNITEKRLPQDGRINYRDFDIRISILPTLYGEKIVMRILGRDTSELSMNMLGMNVEEQKVYLQAVNSSKGIVLISGPTGSGKTTTLYATLKLLNKMSSNILTIEDPIEYTLEGVNQVQIKEEIGLTFTSALKTFLRQDPDIIMLGEIRDEKTAQMAIRASLTGHLVLSTIHTNSAIGTISRLVDMGIPPFLIAETLRISVAQRLVRKLCDYCKIKGDNKDLNLTLDFKTEFKSHYLPVGCDHCYHTGYKGRVAIYEFVLITPEVIDLIKNNNNDSKHNLNSIKYQSLSQKAINLVNDGITTIEEVYSIIIDS
mgnify:CR=1 FL=1|tara:strand:+ start:24790 stop:26196 length:1407 start_codon:yes stop_codon:yes gene_type:complete